MAPYPIILADHHTRLREGIRRIIAEQPDLQVVGEVAGGAALLDLLGSSKVGPLLVVLDATLPDVSGAETVRAIKATHPEAKVLVLSMHEDVEYLRHALAIGAEGYLVVERVGTELLHAIEAIRAGKVYVSPDLAVTTAV